MSDELFMDILLSVFVKLFPIPVFVFVVVHVFVGDWDILIPAPGFNVILSCLLLDNELKQEFSFDI